MIWPKKLEKLTDFIVNTTKIQKDIYPDAVKELHIIIYGGCVHTAEDESVI